ncbi:MAG: hypothetical protein K2P43_06460 [Lachnospiraceae bacterium]|nr:hypothetical protein [Lachnospiraceae bacterium]
MAGWMPADVWTVTAQQKSSQVNPSGVLSNNRGCDIVGDGKGLKEYLIICVE